MLIITFYRLSSLGLKVVLSDILSSFSVFTTFVFFLGVSSNKLIPLLVPDSTESIVSDNISEDEVIIFLLPSLTPLTVDLVVSAVTIPILLIKALKMMIIYQFFSKTWIN